MQSPYPLLSVVIPTHNTRALADEAVESILSQAVPNIEVIVVDDGSSDETSQWMVENRPEVTVLRNEHATGFSAAANRGLTHTQGQILLLLNSDAALAPQSLESMFEAFAANPDLGIAGAELRFPDGTPQWSGGKFPGLVWLFALTSGIAVAANTIPFYRRFKRPGAHLNGPVQWVTGAAMAFRRSLWDNLGPLDEGFRFYGQDLDFCLKASKAGWDIALIPGFVVSHHHGSTIGENDGASDSTHPEFLWTDILRAIDLNRGSPAARRARRVMLLGATIRLTALTVAARLGSRRLRQERRTRKTIFRKALTALRLTSY